MSWVWTVADRQHRDNSRLPAEAERSATRARELLLDNVIDIALARGRTMSVLQGAVSAGVMHPLVAEIDDDTLRADLLRTTRRILNLPGQ
jgi:hypothetical protein